MAGANITLESSTIFKTIRINPGIPRWGSCLLVSLDPIVMLIG